MSAAYTSTIPNALKETLEEVVTDKSDGYESRLLMPQYFTVGTMDDNYVDDLEIGGPGLASLKTEGQEMSTGSIAEGVLTRYTAKTYALKLIITKEAQEDNKYDQVIDFARRLKRAMWKTVDVDAALVLSRMFNTSYPGGDGLPLGSASHTLPQGGTFSNIMSTPMSPGYSAMTIAMAQLRKFPGHDGITDRVEAKKIVCPEEQRMVWKGLFGSTYNPTPGNFTEKNAVKMDTGLGPDDVVAVNYWDTTTTNWAIITDAENGLSWKWRVRPEGNSWLGNDPGLMYFGIRARWDRKWSDPRGALCVNA